MLIFLHGPDSFRSRAKQTQIIEQFKKTRDPRGDNVVFLDGAALSLDELNARAAAQSLLAQKRLIVISGLFGNRSDALFASLLDYLRERGESSDNVLLFYEGQELDATGFGVKKLTGARKKLFSYLTGQPYAEKFSRLTPAQSAALAIKAAARHGITIAPAEAQLLVTLTGNDLWSIHHETNKLAHFAKGGGRDTVTQDDVRFLVRAESDDNIFALTDAVSARNLPRFFTLLETYLDAGMNLSYIISMLARQFSIILQVKELLVGRTAPNAIAGTLKLHPFVVQKAVAQTRNFSLEKLKTIIGTLAEIDYHTKTGRADALTGLNLLFI